MCTRDSSFCDLGSCPWGKYHEGLSIMNVKISNYLKLLQEKLNNVRKKLISRDYSVLS